MNYTGAITIPAATWTLIFPLMLADGYTGKSAMDRIMLMPTTDGVTPQTSSTLFINRSNTNALAPATTPSGTPIGAGAPSLSYEWNYGKGHGHFEANTAWAYCVDGCELVIDCDGNEG